MNSKKNQQGVALAVALVLLVVITLTGIGAIRGAIMQERMSANSVDRALAMQAAESALQDAHRAIVASGGIPAGTYNCVTGLVDNPNDPCPASPVNIRGGNITPPGNSLRWQDAGSGYRTIYAPDTNASTTYASQYAIQYIGFSSGAKAGANADPNVGSGTRGTVEVVQRYRIFARSFNPASNSDRSFVVLQTLADIRRDF